MQQKYLQREYSWARVLSFDTGKTFVTQHPEGGIKEHSCMQREYFLARAFLFDTGRECVDPTQLKAAPS